MAEQMTLRDFQGLLIIDKNALDDELINHSNWFFRVCDALTEQNARMEKGKTERDRVEGELYIEYREEMTGQTKTAKGDPKPPSEAEVRAKIRSDKRYILVDGDFEHEKQEADRWASMREAWKDRHGSLKALAQLYASNYFTTDEAVRLGDRRSTSDRAHEARTEVIKEKYRNRQADNGERSGRVDTETERPPRRASDVGDRGGKVEGDAPPRRVPLKEAR